MDNEKFTHEMLPVLFSNIKLKNIEDFETRYIINAERGFFGDIVIMKGQSGVKNEWRFFLDNYPGQKKYYATNLPFRTVDDFVNDMQRLGVPLVPTTPAPISEQKQEGETNERHEFNFAYDASKAAKEYCDLKGFDPIEGFRFLDGADFGAQWQSQHTARQIDQYKARIAELEAELTTYKTMTRSLAKGK